MSTERETTGQPRTTAQQGDTAEQEGAAEQGDTATRERTAVLDPAYLAYRAASSLALGLPAPMASGAASTLARVLWAAMPERRRTVARHLRRVRGPELRGARLRRATREVFVSYARYWLEAFRMPDETPESLEARMSIEGLEHLEEAYASGNGVVLATPHLGGWDFGGAWLGRHGYRPVAVAEVLEPPELFEWFVEWRERLGVEIVPATAQAGTAVLEALREGRVVTLVADRDILGSGVEVEFFGEVTTLPAGPAVLALRTGAPILPVAVYFEASGHHAGVVRPPLSVSREGRFRDDVTRVTADMAAELELLIRRAPEQWHLLQPNWPSDPGHPGSAGSAGGGARRP